MAPSPQQLKEHIAQRHLVSVRRAKIDSHSIQGFLLAFSDALVLLRYIYDFHSDGYLLLRRHDITDLNFGDTDQFQKKLLEEEGVLGRIDFGYRAPIQSYDAFLASREPEEIVILEDESVEPNRFIIGTVESVHDEEVHVRHFTGIGRALDEPEVISTKRITSCQIATNYILFYQRHFERLKLKDGPTTK